MMDFGESEGEELPIHADSTTSSLEADLNSSSSFPSSGLIDNSLPVHEPPSPGTARKRTKEEVYEKSQRPLSSTTPLKDPPKFKFEHGVSTEPQRSSTWKVAFKDIQASQSTHRSPPMAEDTAEWPDQATNEVTLPKTFVESVAAYQRQLEDDFKEYGNELRGRERSHELAQLDWQELEGQYQKEISVKIADEQEIMKEVQERFNQFMLWMQVSGSRESERAVKRLRTRIALVQTSEDQLGRRQDHYGKVLTAFQNAMALLGNA